MKKILIAVFIMAFLACACGKRELVPIATDADLTQGIAAVANDNHTNDEGTDPSSDMGVEGQTEIPAKEVLQYTYICGAVNKPGVYEFKDADRLFNILELAGGASADAALEYVNLAQPITDGSQIVIPSNEDIAQLIESGAAGRADILDALQRQFGATSVQALSAGGGEDGKVNINTASADMLQTLSGIGKKRAEDIVAYRTGHGDFKSIDDIKNVTGIKGGVFEGIKDFITVK